MKKILILAVVAIAASLAGALPLFHSSFAAPGQTASPDSQDPTEQVNDKETNEDAEETGSISPQAASQATITVDQAKNIAATHISAQPSDVQSASLEDEAGQLVYSVEIVKAGSLFDVEVDAINGQVSNVEQETEGETDDKAEHEQEDK